MCSLYLSPRKMTSLLIFLLLASASAKQVLQYDFDVLGRPSEFAKRDETTQVTLANDRVGYYLNFSLGSPEQQFYGQIDTGSSDLWVLGPNSEYCESGELPSFTSSAGLAIPGPTHVVFPDYDCQGFGSFSANESETYRGSNERFEIVYGDGTYAKGTWSKDTLLIGDDIEIKNFMFGLAISGNSTPVFGIGYPSIESSASGLVPGENFTYLNLPQRLAKENIIKTPAYSLYLDARDSPVGSILFGGVDHSKYSGNLTTYPIVTDELRITLQGIGVQTGDKFQRVIEGEQAVLLDSGTTRMALPSSWLVYLTQGYMEYSYYGDTYVLSCSDALNISWVFQFGDNSIQVPALDFMLQDDDGVCYLLVAETDTVILGDYFLRHAYVVYDLYNREISIAEAKYDTGEPDIEEIDTDGVPRATKASAKVVTSAWYAPVGETSLIQTDEGVITTETLAFPTSTDDSDQHSESKSHGAAGKIEASVLAGFFTLLSILCII